MTDQEYWNRRARGMGGRYTTGAEENVLGYPGTRYFGEHILVHEFWHGIRARCGPRTPCLPAAAGRLRRAQEQKLYPCQRLAALRRQHYRGVLGGRHPVVVLEQFTAVFAEGGQPDGRPGRGIEARGPAALRPRPCTTSWAACTRTITFPLDVYYGRRLRKRGSGGSSGSSAVQPPTIWPAPRSARPQVPQAWPANQRPTRCCVRTTRAGTRRRLRRTWPSSAPAAAVSPIEVQRKWAPLGADRFYNLVRNGYYDDGRFHRVDSGYIAQWGARRSRRVSRLEGAVHRHDPVQLSNTRGTIGFAMTGPNTRSVQVYIDLGDNSRERCRRVRTVGRSQIEGLDVVDGLFSGYGEDSGGGLRGGKQGPLEAGGNDYLTREYPLLDFIRYARIRFQPAAVT